MGKAKRPAFMAESRRAMDIRVVRVVGARQVRVGQRDGHRAQWRGQVGQVIDGASVGGPRSVPQVAVVWGGRSPPSAGVARTCYAMASGRGARRLRPSEGRSRAGRVAMTPEQGTKEQPWALTTPSGTAEYTMYRDDTRTPPILVCTVGTTVLRYDARCLSDLHAMLTEHGDWMDLGSER